MQEGPATYSHRTRPVVRQRTSRGYTVMYSKCYSNKGTSKGRHKHTMTRKVQDSPSLLARLGRARVRTAQASRRNRTTRRHRIVKLPVRRPDLHRRNFHARHHPHLSLRRARRVLRTSSRSSACRKSNTGFRPPERDSQLLGQAWKELMTTRATSISRTVQEERAWTRSTRSSSGAEEPHTVRIHTSKTDLRDGWN